MDSRSDLATEALPAAAPSAGSLAPHPPLDPYYRENEQKHQFLRRMFDETAVDYDRMEGIMALGSGPWYRRRALRRAGLKPGMRVLDVAMGTGLVARAAVEILGGPRGVVGLDPSAGMIAQAARTLSIPVIMGTAEHLPVADDSFEFISMGYGLRHLYDLSTAFREFHRALRPGGTACVLEITRPRGRATMALLRWYLKGIVPRLSRPFHRTAGTQVLWRYHWDTIEACIPPDQVMDAMRAGGFVDVSRKVELGIFSEYVGRRPDSK